MFQLRMRGWHYVNGRKKMTNCYDLKIVHWKACHS